MIYPVDSAIHRLKNWGLNNEEPCMVMEATGVFPPSVQAKAVHVFGLVHMYQNVPAFLIGQFNHTSKL